MSREGCQYSDRNEVSSFMLVPVKGWGLGRKASEGRGSLGRGPPGYPAKNNPFPLYNAMNM